MLYFIDTRLRRTVNRPMDHTLKVLTVIVLLLMAASINIFR